MARIEFNFCSTCSTRLVIKDMHPWCNHCQVFFYRNSKPAAGVAIIKAGQVLLARRGIEPHKGELDIIGGYLRDGELPLDGALREVKEETGLDVQIVDLLGMYVDEYLDGGYILAIHYVAEMIDGDPVAHDDVAALEWYDINTIPRSLGFKNTVETLQDLKKWWTSKNR